MGTGTRGVIAGRGAPSRPPSRASVKPSTTAVNRRSTPSARADRQVPLPMFRCPGSPGLLITFTACSFAP